MAADQALVGLDRLELELRSDRGRSGQLASKAWAATWPKLLATGLVLIGWQVGVWLGYQPYLIKSPATVFADLWQQLHHALLWHAIGTTVQRAIVGYGVALLIGVAIGIVVSRIPPLRAAVGSIISALQTMPSIAWFPFAIILFGLNTAAIVFVMVLGAAPSIANGLITGVDYTPPLLLRAGKVMGLRRLQLYRSLILPASLPSFVAGMKQGWAFAWRSLMAGELLVIIPGLVSVGQLLNVAQEQQDMTGAISIMIVILVLGIVVDALFTKADLAVRRRRGLIDSAT